MAQRNREHPKRTKCAHVFFLKHQLGDFVEAPRLSTTCQARELGLRLSGASPLRESTILGATKTRSTHLNLENGASVSVRADEYHHGFHCQ